MSEMYEPPQPEKRPPLTVVAMPRPQPPRSAGSGIARFFLWLAFLGSMALNFFLLMIVLGIQGLAGGDGFGGSTRLQEHFHGGKRTSKNKIAIVKVDGAIMEGMLSYAHKEIEEAAGDSNVKAIVLRINSPGGSISASDDLYRRLLNLRDGKTPGHPSPKKPIVVSMASLAASGGYYIAMAGEQLLAERTSLTGSIGVYAAFPNVSELANKYGFDMIVIKSDALKDSGSPFKPMKPQERQLWQEMVDHAYAQFLGVVEEGRPKLKGKLQVNVEERPIPVEGGKPVDYVRKRADGGIFTADKALKYGLIDRIGDLETAIEEAAKAAGVADDYRAVSYQKPLTLIDLFGVRQNQPAQGLAELAQLAQLATPRLWYLAPQFEFAGVLPALRMQE